MNFQVKIRTMFLVTFITACNTYNGAKETYQPLLAEQNAISPKNQTEKIILEKAPASKFGTTVSVGESSFVVTNEYFAASGRECKTLQIKLSSDDTPDMKTICNFNGEWGYSPEVFPAASPQ